MTEKIIDATIFIFRRLLNEARFSPSAKKFHYVFNLRELSKVTEGIMQAQPSSYKGQSDKVVRLWIHECKRVFEDRLINTEDIKFFRDFMKEAL